MIPFQRLSWKHLIKAMPAFYPGVRWWAQFQLDEKIKTSLRNTRTDERLSSLAILHIHNFDKDANDNVA